LTRPPPPSTLFPYRRSSDLTLRIWDVSIGAPVTILPGQGLLPFSIDLSRDDTKLVTNSLDSSIRVWDPRTGKLLASLVGHTNGVDRKSTRLNSSHLVISYAV